MVIELVLQDIAGAFGSGVHGMTAQAAQVIGQLVRGDGEQISLKLAALVVVGQAVEEADKSFLDHVFAGGPVVEPAFDESQQPAVVAPISLAQASGSCWRIC